jgi:hypothetical protein
MSIRFVISDRATGETHVAEAPRRGEVVKDGVRKLAQPSREACDGLRGLIAKRSKLGAKGGIYA